MAKERYRTKDRESWKSRQKSKKEQQKLKKDRQISRERRNFIRKNVLNYCLRFRELKDQHILFVLDTKENTEQVLLQKHMLDSKKCLLTLPIIAENDIYNYIIDTNVSLDEKTTSLSFGTNINFLQGFIKEKYGILPNKIEFLFDQRLIVVKVSMVLNIHDDLVETIIKPYDDYSWFATNSDFTTVMGKNVYTGKSIERFMTINDSKLNYFIHQDTISELVIYKTKEGNLDPKDSFMDLNIYGRRPTTRNFTLAIRKILDDDYNEETASRVIKGTKEMKEYTKKYPHQL